jgi:formate/nitrite transporter FocA (FNT family)
MVITINMPPTIWPSLVSIVEPIVSSQWLVILLVAKPSLVTGPRIFSLLSLHFLLYLNLHNIHKHIPLKLVFSYVFSCALIHITINVLIDATKLL